MVTAIRRGNSLRAVAAKFDVSKTTVERWINRTKGKRLDRVDWNDRPDGSPRPINRSAGNVEKCVLKLRKELKENSPLGEHGADAILREMKLLGCHNMPSRATVNRILKRHGELDVRNRKRRTPPPPDWYLKDVAKGLAELDQFDYVEDLCIQGGKIFNVLNGISLHGGLACSWPMSRMTAENTVRSMIEFWYEYGLPDYAQFDNSTVFQGGRWPDTLGKVIRCCLSLGVSPVFAPPRKNSFQASIESYNGRWERGVWHRFHFENIRAVQKQSKLYVNAVREKNAERLEASPCRCLIAPDWQLDYGAKPQGKVIFIRRSDDGEGVMAMGHRWIVKGAGSHKLVRAEVDLTENEISFYRLRRSEPTVHEYLGDAEYHFPNKPFKEN